MLTFEAKPDHVPHKFHFGEAKTDVAEMTYQRYQDADLITASAEVDLEASYGRPSYAWLWWVGGAVLIIFAGLVSMLYFAMRKPTKNKEVRWQLPERLNAFTVMGVLQRIQETNNLSEPEKGELRETIARLERHYFAGQENGPVDLRSIAEIWVNKAR
jgi:hypothetical protein